MASNFSSKPRRSRLKQKYTAGETIRWVLLDILSLELVEMLGDLGCDCVMIEAEHAAYDERLIAQICQVAAISGMTPAVRLRTIRHDQIGRLLDIGIQCLHATHVRSQTEAHHLVQCAKYPPAGDRGWGRFAAVNGYGLIDEHDAVAAGNEEILLSVCIEDVEGAANIRAICTTPGIDAISIGASDLAASMGITGQYQNPAFTAKLCEIEGAISASLLAGKRLFQPGDARNIGAPLGRRLEHCEKRCLLPMGKCVFASDLLGVS